jgi:hypothetical protein
MTAVIEVTGLTKHYGGQVMRQIGNFPRSDRPCTRCVTAGWAWLRGPNTWA